MTDGGTDVLTGRNDERNDGQPKSGAIYIASGVLGVVHILSIFWDTFIASLTIKLRTKFHIKPFSQYIGY